MLHISISLNKVNNLYFTYMNNKFFQPYITSFFQSFENDILGGYHVNWESKTRRHFTWHIEEIRTLWTVYVQFDIIAGKPLHVWSRQ